MMGNTWRSGETLLSAPINRNYRSTRVETCRLGRRFTSRPNRLGATLALLTALYEDGVRAVAMRGGLASYLSVLRDPFCYVPLDANIPGLLQKADVADIAAAFSPRPMLVEGLVDGRNRALETREVEREMGPAYAAYRNSPSQLLVRRGPDPDFAGWLVRQLRDR